jgi:hypothetical protein
MYRILILFVSLGLICGSCVAQRTEIASASQSILEDLAKYEKLDSKHSADIAKVTEPGERLIVMSRLVSKETKKPIANQEIHIYQADIKGSYGETKPGDESTARISGDLTTDGNGLFMIKTILPGDYGTTAGNKHIHLNVPIAKPSAYDFFFGDYMGYSLISWATRSDQAIVLTLEKRNDGVLIAKKDLVVRGFSQ